VGKKGKRGMYRVSYGGLGGRVRVRYFIAYGNWNLYIFIYGWFLEDLYCLM
jgi:hypothetical protein